MTTPRPATAAVPLPDPLKNLIKRLAPGWEHRTSYTRGTIARYTTDDSKPEGQRRTLVHEPCESYSLRLRRGEQRAYAVWVRREGRARWSFDHARTWSLCIDPTCARREHMHADDVPRSIGARELATHLSTTEEAAA